MLHRRGPSSGDRYEPEAAGRSRATRSHRPWVDGRTERSMVVRRSAAIASMATSSRRRAPKPCAVRSASMRARSKRRSTTCWTRRRSGWNSANANERGRRDGKRRRLGDLRQHGLQREHAADEHGDQDGRDHRPGHRAADDPVDVPQPVPQDRDPRRDRDPRGRDQRDHERGVVERRERDDQGHEEGHVGQEEPLHLLPLDGTGSPEPDEQGADADHAQRRDGREVQGLDQPEDARERIDAEGVGQGAEPGVEAVPGGARSP